MNRGDQEVRSRTKYILGKDSRLFQNVAVQDARHNIDYYLVLVCLRRADPAAHLRNLGKRTRFPIRPPAPPDKAYRIFAELQESIPQAPPVGAPLSGLDLPCDLESD